MRHIKYQAQIAPTQLRRFRRAVLKFYRTEGRDLPWRRTRDPYAILVSEILLHQTTVATVEPVYEAFMAQFPTVDALARAELDAVKGITDPLGYKIRGTWLWHIAQRVTTAHRGRMPRTLSGLMDLPGVGRYTAGAVMSFAYGRRAGVLDTNVSRVLGRFFQVPADGTAERQHQLWALAEAVVPVRHAWQFNQGVMDFGALCCRARQPLCTRCPLARHCPAAEGRAESAAEGVPAGVWFWDAPGGVRRRPAARG